MSDSHLIISALFVDFDNIYSAIRDFPNSSAADEFAANPSRWLRWFQDGQHESSNGPKRRVVVRRCYLNPKIYDETRDSFVKSGFNVIDTPSLTGMKKSAADIRMAMDIMDYLHHSTPFEEFIILSSDADFTPVVIRLREHSRLTSILAKENTAAALRTATDFVVPLQSFISDALKPAFQTSKIAIVPQPPPPPIYDHAPVERLDLDDLEKKVGAFITEALKQSSRPIYLSALGLRLKRHEVWGMHYADSGYCGYGSLTALVHKLEEDGLFNLVDVEHAYILDPKRHIPFEAELG